MKPEFYPEFYQVEWGNGNTDVFADRHDAIQDWQNSNTADDEEYGNHIKNGGFFTETPDGPDTSCTEWSKAALAKLQAA
jgi:hypothetical protein